jgi:hypothetical protein
MVVVTVGRLRLVHDAEASGREEDAVGKNYAKHRQPEGHQQDQHDAQRPGEWRRRRQCWEVSVHSRPIIEGWQAKVSSG